ncbi:hypothetical protein M430DRAFT_37226 [Amorphotheca resinae ATCC 22711]|uniref:Uncharacterized protein n=1 Tax=Amorphotheca resinae ATCC 22711 TaxID=857342 RepID=A0A2T3AS21_AMORE|nr:hypothetical protein M430DRAFT_37226 [Amorphotheca resinae ATCC 22711]PSS09170.1 hypothetical protein M430DRAFT_37226 [Amorphotheca resinae ATCC 22711]
MELVLSTTLFFKTSSISLDLLNVDSNQASDFPLDSTPYNHTIIHSNAPPRDQISFNMAPASNEEQFKFLISCIRYSNNGKVRTAISEY